MGLFSYHGVFYDHIASKNLAYLAGAAKVHPIEDLKTLEGGGVTGNGTIIVFGVQFGNHRTICSKDDLQCIRYSH